MYAKTRKVFLALFAVISASLFVACDDLFSPVELTAPEDVTVTAASKGNQVIVTWTDNGASNYWIYYNSTNDTETATLFSRYATTGRYGREVPLSSTGTYYFWVKAADGYSKTSHTSGFSSVATYDFTYTPLSVPTGVSVKKSEDYTNKVTVNWTDNGATCYWVYYNKSNDTSTATCATNYTVGGLWGYDITLEASGTYYFWVKAADGGEQNSATSDFSSVAQFEFTHTDLSTPTDVSVSGKNGSSNKVIVNWTDNGASYYWVYYNSTNDTSTATCDNRYVSSGKYGWEITLPSPGTYYFWVKAADGSKDNSPTSDFSSAATYTY